MSGCVSLAERLELGGGKTITTASTWTRQLAGKHTGSQLWSSTSARSEAACSICKRIPSQLNAIADKWEKERTQRFTRRTHRKIEIYCATKLQLHSFLFYSISLWPQTALAVEDLLHTTCTWIVFVQWGMACQAPSDKWQRMASEKGQRKQPVETVFWFTESCCSGVQKFYFISFNFKYAVGPTTRVKF